jgi:putative FmdB family regulatory protein
VPTYQYACTECGEHLEAVQSFSDPALTVCPACQGKLRKVFNSVGIVFKGSGFYRNDSRKPATSDNSSSDSSASTKSDSSATKSDSSSTKSDSSSTKSDSSASSTSSSSGTAAKATAATPS